MKFNKALAYLLILTALVITGCKDREPAEPKGTWIKHSTNSEKQALGTLELKDNSLFFFTTQAPGHTDTKGRYSLTENQITFEDDTCYSPGTYTYRVSKKEITFILLSDHCAERVKILEGQWSRKK